LHLRRSNQFLIAKRKELAMLKQLFFLRYFQMIDARLPDAMTNKIHTKNKIGRF
tara:strand:+ start:240 stop:401 length:162 start_codon:yes stop_codon:yes gene_type:complete